MMSSIGADGLEHVDSAARRTSQSPEHVACMFCVKVWFASSSLHVDWLASWFTRAEITKWETLDLLERAGLWSESRCIQHSGTGGKQKVEVHHIKPHVLREDVTQCGRMFGVQMKRWSRRWFDMTSEVKKWNCKLQFEDLANTNFNLTFESLYFGMKSIKEERMEVFFKHNSTINIQRVNGREDGRGQWWKWWIIWVETGKAM